MRGRVKTGDKVYDREGVRQFGQQLAANGVITKVRNGLFRVLWDSLDQTWCEAEDLMPAA
ncbi:hypothetical protein MycrhDRAFT_5736 [Mycolicibacterium rhodesiae JS60]|nr:hypothetical protein MycrhDRAFT_5736 [Mycolicibacterium rhodesiae JS60]